MNDQHYAILQATLAAEAAAALAASDGKTISIYENLWGMGWSRNEIRRAANFVGDVEGARNAPRNARLFIDLIPDEMDRAERVVGTGTKGDWRTHLKATLIKRGWGPGECAAALHFVLFVHFSNKEIIEQTRQQSKARREAIKCATTQN